MVPQEVEAKGEVVFYDKIYGYIKSTFGELLVNTFGWTNQVQVINNRSYHKKLSAMLCSTYTDMDTDTTRTQTQKYV